VKSGNADGAKVSHNIDREKGKHHLYAEAGKKMTRDLTRIGERARQNGQEKFTSIYHYVSDADHLVRCYGELEAERASGIDGVSKEEWGRELKRNILELSDKLGRMGYRPQPVRRVYIPKVGSDKKRPLGILCFEDKLVHTSLARVLEQIYEADFLDCSYGYRRGRTQHGLLDELGRTIQQKKVSYVVEADIRGFFDQVNHEWLIKFLEVRIGDERVIRLVKRMLRGGVMEDGLIKASDDGVPQGSPLSPLLSNVYLHYALDLWMERRFKHECRGEAYYFRYADDFVACFQYREDAERYLQEMEERLKKFHLEIEPSKTRLMKFGRFAEKDAKRQGGTPAEFDFLGFTHYCSQTRKGSFKVKRRTSKKKFRAKLKDMKEWLKSERSLRKKGELLKQAKRKVEGHLNYYAITDNYYRCKAYSQQVRRLLYKWLNRQSQRRSYTWKQLDSALAWVRWPTISIRHNLDPFRRAREPALNGG